MKTYPKTDLKTSFFPCLAGLALAALALTLAPRPAQAQVFSDTLSTNISPRTGDAPLTYFSGVTTDTALTSFSIYNQMVTAGSLKFLIFDDITQDLLYSSAPIAYGADAALTWKQSPTFSFTLRAGQSYDIGALANVNANYGYNTSGDLTQNGLTSAQANQNVQTFATPVLFGHAGGRIPIILNGTQAVPEASPAASLGLLLALGLGGIVVAAKRRKA